MVNIKSLESKHLSFYRTSHHIERYGELKTVDDFRDYCEWAKTNKSNIYILGNGSNTLFVRRNVKTLILKNKLDKYIKPLSESRLEISSSVLIADVLKHCCENSLDSFYYLASVPATIGGALAMNAGRGREHGATIYDFVEEVTYFEDGYVKTLAKDDIHRDYRQTMFTGVQSRLILSAVFNFDRKTFDYDPIAERREWSKQWQDNSEPNCGSVFKLAHPKTLDRLKGFGIGKTRFSSKTYNWILNKSDSSLPILILIQIAKLIHILRGKRIALEVITVD